MGEFSEDYTSFFAAASFDSSIFDDDLAEDGGFALGTGHGAVSATDETVVLIRVAGGKFVPGFEELAKEPFLVGLGDVFSEELLCHSVLESLTVSSGDAVTFVGVICKEVAIATEGVLVQGLGGGGASFGEFGALSVDGVAVGALFPNEIPFGVAAKARGGDLVGAFGGAVFADVGGVFGVNFAEDAALVEITAEAGTAHVRVGEVMLALLVGFAERPAGKAFLNGAGDTAEAGIEVVEDGAGHFHERPGEEKREKLDSDAENNAEAAVSGDDDSVADELRSAEEEAEHGVEN